MDEELRKKIPGNLLDELLARRDPVKFKEENFIYSAQFDLSIQRYYMDGYVILSKSSLIIASAPDNGKAARLFGGYRDKKAGDGNEQSRNFKIEGYPLSDIEKLEIQMLVSGGLLYAQRKGQAEQVLACFTNSCMDDMKRLVKLFGKAKEDKEITISDFEQKGEDECCPKCGMRYPNKNRKICPKCMDKRSIFIRMFSYFKPHRVRLYVMVLCYIGTAMLNLIWPYLNGTVLYDRVLAKDMHFMKLVSLKTAHFFPVGKFVVLLGGVVLVMVLTSLTTQLCTMLQGVLAAKIVPDVVKNIKTEVFRSMGRLSVSFYNKRQTGSLMTRILDDADRVTDFYINGLPYFFIHMLTIIFISIVMFSINWKLAIACLILLPFLTIISIRMLPSLWSRYGRRHRVTRNLNAQINDNITGARVVKAFGQEESELHRFGIYNSRVKQSELSLVNYDNRYKALYNTVQNLSYYMALSFGSALILGKTSLKLGILITFLGYVSQLKGPLDFMAQIFFWWTDSINCSQRIFEIMDTIPEIQEIPSPVTLKNMKGDIILNHVTFGYEAHKPVLKDVSFHVEAGKMLGIVGRSGAGKSTLVNLISRLYDAEEGEILIDGINIKNLSLEDLHKNIAMVSQETYIFMGTVAQNIAYAKPDATIEEIMRAAVLASAHDFICRMPDGYDTIIGSSGRDLSGGERQRISIARAVLANPKILILDEATASVDTETEAAIQKSLSYLVKGRTTISIAHRLSTLKDADSLVVIDDGKLTESGTHQELIGRKGTYHKLMKLQTKALALRGIE